MRDIDAVLGSLLKLLQPGMPKVVPDQRRKFQHDDLLKRLTEDNPIAYSPHRDRPVSERRSLMRQELQEGFLTVAVCNMGLTLRLVFDSSPWTPKPNGQREVTPEEVRLDESGRIHLKSRFILNGVCIQWQGYMDSHSLSGRGRILFDADRAEVENQILRDQLLEYHRLHNSCYAMSTTAAASAAAAAAAAAGAAGGGASSMSHRPAPWPQHSTSGAGSPAPPPPPPTPQHEHHYHHEQQQLEHHYHHEQQQQEHHYHHEQQQHEHHYHHEQQPEWQSLSPSGASGSEGAGES